MKKQYFLGTLLAIFFGTFLAFRSLFFAGPQPESLMPEDGMPYYFQFDERFGNYPYGDGSIKETGCGPVSLAMALSGLLEFTVTPTQIAEYSERNGYYVEGTGTAWALFADYAARYGVRTWQSILDEASLIQQLRSGNVLLFSVGPGDFTSSGHILAAKGIDGSSQTNVHDPNSQQNSKRWPLSTILQQAWAVFVLEKPEAGR